MSQSPFLPDAASDYPIADPNPKGFTEGSSDLLQYIGDNMEVRRAATEGRIPSPVSRAYMFYANLFQDSIGESSNGTNENDEAVIAASEGREALQQDARRTLRGLLAAFALRKVLNLDIRSKSVKLLEDDPSDVSAVLVPTLAATPGGKDLWNPVQFYTVVNEEGREEVLAGRSPLTGLYPSATALSQTLNGVYWYEYSEKEGGNETPTGTWYDPTSRTLDEKGKVRISNKTREKTPGLIKAWLDAVLREVDTNTLEQVLGMEAPDASNFIDELKKWKKELRSVDIPQNVEVINERLTDESGRVDLPFLSHVVVASAENVLTDLPIHDGHLVVMQEKLRNNSDRIYGRIYGSNKIEEELDQLGHKGENLGKDLNLGEGAIPMPYLFIDRLFAPNLTIITSHDSDREDHGGLSDEWSGLEVDFGGVTEYYFIPLDPSILEIISPDKLKVALSARRNSTDGRYIVELEFDDVIVTKRYNTRNNTENEDRYRLDQQVGRDEFDLRLFPNYDLDAVRHLISDNDADTSRADDTYYARVRLSPTWDFRGVDPFILREGKVRQSTYDDKLILGTEKRQGDQYSPGKAAFYTISDKPTGFHVPERGFCLLELDDPTGSGINAKNWSVGIDFGTSNTCVAFRKAKDADPEPIQLPVMTTTLLQTPNYSARFGDVCEGASAVLDFFYKFGGQDQSLMSQPYFPTQIVTQQESIKEKNVFDIKNGLIFFENIGVAGPSITGMIEEFRDDDDDHTTPRMPSKFNLKQNIKWENEEWLKVFMQHLRKQVMLTAAKNNARVSDLYFSYPKSFSFRKERKFESTLRDVWGSNLSVISESEAARDYVVEGFGQHLIIDIGGGTTDIVAFNSQRPVFQASFKLAAGQINDYVRTSSDLKKDIASIFRSKFPNEAADIGGLESFTDTDNPITTLPIWFGLLQSLGDDDRSERDEDLVSYIFDELRDRCTGEDHVQGIFLSNAILFCGILYYAGQLLRKASEGKLQHDGFRLSEVTVNLIGNGSRLISVLNNSKYPFTDILKKMLLHGMDVSEEEMESGAVTAQFEDVMTPEGQKTSPKAAVALGLVDRSRNQTSDEELVDIPVANIVAEDGYPIGDGMTTIETPLIEYYRKLKENGIGSFEPQDNIPPNLDRFFDLIGEALPIGKNGRYDVIPEVGKEWSRKLKDSIYPKAAHKIRHRVRSEANDIENMDGMEQDPPALEPMFVAQLAGFLEAIREEYSS